MKGPLSSPEIPLKTSSLEAATFPAISAKCSHKNIIPGPAGWVQKPWHPSLLPISNPFSRLQ